MIQRYSRCVDIYRCPTLLYILQTPFFNILVPTIDTKRYGFLMERLLDVGHSVLFTGTTGVGKVRIRTCSTTLLCDKKSMEKMCHL